MQLPLGLTLPMTQTKWSSILNPLIANPSLQSSQLTGIVLKNGTTIINHLLGRNLIGWRIIGIDGVATIYDKQKSNQTPNLTLVLVSSSEVTVNLEVF